MMSIIGSVAMSIGADPRSAAGLYERKWERFAVNRQGMLMTVGFDLAAPKMRSCKMVDISQGGASFIVSTTIGLPLERRPLRAHTGPLSPSAMRTGSGKRIRKPPRYAMRRRTGRHARPAA